MKNDIKEISLEKEGQNVTITGWVKTIRNHGGVVFLDIRKEDEIIQVVTDSDEFQIESLVEVTGKIVKRAENLVNKQIRTGEFELVASNIKIISSCKTLPYPIGQNVNDELKFKYRYLDLREGKTRNNIITRAKLLNVVRGFMIDNDIMEFQTPILSSPSPEGARDYVVPSRKHENKFYALPQAPQIFKQLIMVSGFPSYYQIAPCFRDEDGRADRTTGEFYQIDMEFAFLTEEEIHTRIELLVRHIYKKMELKIEDLPFIKIPYDEALEKYGSDKPDLRNPLVIKNVTEFFKETEFKPFQNKIVKMIAVPGIFEKPKSFFEKACNDMLSEYSKHIGWSKNDGGNIRGSLSKVIGKEILEIYNEKLVNESDCLFFVAEENKDESNKFCGELRKYLGNISNLIDTKYDKFCWIVDFPMYEYENGKWDFAHNPFSMPKGNAEEKENLKAHQYDLVCNGYELASGAIRNHNADNLIDSFINVGYTREEVEKRFGGLIEGLRYGAPPHGGAAIGLERLLMIITKEERVRDVVLFPLSQQGEDYLLGGPFEIDAKQYNELNIRKRK